MQSKFKLSFIVAALALQAFAVSVQAESARKVGGVKTPESIAVASDGKIYVSEIGEFGKDGDGQISVVDADGALQVFATGMDDPKGIDFHGDTLYVADNKRVLKVGPDGKWEVFAAADAFPVQPQFLNDIVVDGLGNVYVSDSGDLKGKGGAIFRISKNGKVKTIVDSKNPLVLGPNGLLVGPRGKLLEVDFVSGIMYSVNVKTGELTKMAEGLGAADGLIRAKNGLYYVSDWKEGKVYSVAKNGEVKLVKDDFTAAADITLSHDGKHVLVPDMKAGELVWLPIN